MRIEKLKEKTKNKKLAKLAFNNLNTDSSNIFTEDYFMKNLLLQD